MPKNLFWLSYMEDSVITHCFCCRFFYSFTAAIHHVLNLSNSLNRVFLLFILLVALQGTGKTIVSFLPIRCGHIAITRFAISFCPFVFMANFEKLVVQRERLVVFPQIKIALGTGKVINSSLARSEIAGVFHYPVHVFVAILKIVFIVKTDSHICFVPLVEFVNFIQFGKDKKSFVIFSTLKIVNGAIKLFTVVRNGQYFRTGLLYCNERNHNKKQGNYDFSPSSHGVNRSAVVP